MDIQNSVDKYLVLNLNRTDNELINDYLKGVKKRSPGAYRNQKGKIIDCIKYINKNLESIKMKDIITYFEEVLDKRKMIIDIRSGKIKRIGRNIQRVIIDKETEQEKYLSVDSKETIRSYLTSFFFYVQGRLLDNGIDFRNPVPNSRVFKFKSTELDFRRHPREIDLVFSKEELSQILEKTKKKKYRDFIIFSILTICGPRISEVLSIKIRHINLEERYFETGFAYGARKSTRTRRESLIFFFSENFKHYLEKYLLKLDTKSEWLFPGRTSHLQSSSFYEYIKDNYTSIVK